MSVRAATPSARSGDRLKAVLAAGFTPSGTESEPDFHELPVERPASPACHGLGAVDIEPLRSVVDVALEGYVPVATGPPAGKRKQEA